MDLSGRRCRGGALPPGLAGQAAGSRAPGRAGLRYLCLGGSDRRAPDRRAGPRRAERRLVTILRREAAAGVSAALLHFADACCAAGVAIPTAGKQPRNLGLGRFPEATTRVRTLEA